MTARLGLFFAVELLSGCAAQSAAPARPSDHRE
jgi:hypothetical protein